MNALVVANTQTMHASLAAKIIPTDPVVRSTLPRMFDPSTAAGITALNAEVVACRACQVAGYLEHANPIRPGLIAQPKVMLIGQAPGTVSDKKGYHFAGPAGTFRHVPALGQRPNPHHREPAEVLRPV